MVSSAGALKHFVAYVKTSLLEPQNNPIGWKPLMKTWIEILQNCFIMFIMY